MAGFQTNIVLPDPREKVSGFFKVVFPTFFLTLIVAFFRGYYKMNGYDMPFYLGWPFFAFLFFMALLWVYLWYHQNHDKVGNLNLSGSEISYDWRGTSVKHDIKEVKDLAITYDGFSAVSSAATGINNFLSFNSRGKEVGFNFELSSQEHADEMAEIIKEWYANGISIKEQSSKGEERYLMMYDPKFKKANLA